MSVCPAVRPTFVLSDKLPISTLVSVIEFEFIDGETMDVAAT